MRKTISILLAAALLLAAAFSSACSLIPSAVFDPHTSEPVSGEPIEIHSGTEAPGESTSDPQPAIAFVCTLDYAPENGIAELCLTPSGAPDWGEPAAENVACGEMLILPFAQSAAPDGRFDIGASDQNGVNYDAFGVSLSPGDLITLSGSWCTGVFTVAHMNGSRDIYPASLSRSLPEAALNAIALVREDVQLECADGASSAGHICYTRLSLGGEDAARFPLLAQALAVLDEERIARLNEKLIAAVSGGGEPAETPAETPEETPDPGQGEDEDPDQSDAPVTEAPAETPAPGALAPAPSFEPVKECGGPIAAERVMVCRADETVVSLLFETRTENTVSDAAPVCFAVTLDTESGERLMLSDITADVQALPHMLNTALKSAGSELEINEYRSHVRDFSTERGDYAFALTAEGILFVFNENAFRSGCEAGQCAFIGCGADPLLIYLKYLTPAAEADGD